MLEDFIQKYKDTLVNFDGVPEHSGESMQLIALWCKTLGLPFRWPLPRDWFVERTDDAFAEYWQMYAYGDVSDAVPRPGDIIMFEDDMPGGDGNGHASIFVSWEGDNDWIGFDSDWDGDVAHLQHHHTLLYMRWWFTPAIETERPKPIVGPARKYGSIAMTAPLRIGNSEDTIMIDEPVPMYHSWSQAAQGVRQDGLVPIHKYYVYRRMNGMMQLTRELGQPQGIWINPKDLEPKKEELLVIDTAGKSVTEVLAETVPSPTLQQRIEEDYDTIPPLPPSYPPTHPSDEWDLSPIQSPILGVENVRTHYGKLFLKLIKQSAVMKAIKEKYKEL